MPKSMRSNFLPSTASRHKALVVAIQTAPESVSRNPLEVKSPTRLSAALNPPRAAMRSPASLVSRARLALGQWMEYLCRAHGRHVDAPNARAGTDHAGKLAHVAIAGERLRALPDRRFRGRTCGCPPEGSAAPEERAALMSAAGKKGGGRPKSADRLRSDRNNRS